MRRVDGFVFARRFFVSFLAAGAVFLSFAVYVAGPANVDAVGGPRFWVVTATTWFVSFAFALVVSHRRDRFRCFAAFSLTYLIWLALYELVIVHDVGLQVEPVPLRRTRIYFAGGLLIAYLLAFQGGYRRLGLGIHWE